jgi:hypothetical protein
MTLDAGGAHPPTGDRTTLTAKSNLSTKKTHERPRKS